MRTLLALAAVTLLSLPATARAQRATRAIAVESRLVAASGAPAGALALTASWWLEGDLHATASAAWPVAGGTADRAVSASAGLAWAPGAARLRPRVLAEAGSAWIVRSGRMAGRMVVAAGIGVEWFVKRELALTAGARLEGRGAGWLALGGAVGLAFGL